MFGLGFGEIAIILFIALVFIGPKKLPELAKGLGKGMREFQNAARGLQEHVSNPVNEVKDQIMDKDSHKGGDTDVPNPNTHDEIHIRPDAHAKAQASDEEDKKNS